MDFLKRYTTIITVGLILGILAGLGIWYLFIRGQQGTIEETGVGRGFGGGVPTFRGALGSINENARTALGFLGDTFTQTVGVQATNASSTYTPPPLWLVSSTPTVGFSYIRSGDPAVLYFVEQVSGNIFSVDTRTGKVSRVTNTLIPYTKEVIWVNASTTIMRALTDRGSATAFLGTITNSTSTATLEGDYLPGGIHSIAAAPEGDRFFYILPQSSGSVGIVYTLATGAEKRVWSSPVGGWHTEWVDTNHIIFSQYAAEGVSGSVYVLSVDTGLFTPLLTSVAGMSASVSPSRENIIYSESFVGKMTTYMRVGDATKMVSLTTLGEKCVWGDDTVAYCAVPKEISEEVAYPDDWYKGTYHTSDEWWIVYPETGAKELLLSPESEFSQPIDVRDPVMSADGSFIMYTDARTGVPWVTQTKR